MNHCLLGPRDPEGYYVVRVPRKLLKNIMGKYGNKIKIIEIGEEVLIRTKSRRIALGIIKMLNTVENSQ